jgi:hypothetical protein
MNIERGISKVDRNPKLVEGRYRNGRRRKGHFIVTRQLG